jgi:hypothetical protein
LKNIRHAGAIFLGPYSPAAVGDYVAGPSHVLPTHGTARFSSGLSVFDFVKSSHIIGYLVILTAGFIGAYSLGITFKSLLTIRAPGKDKDKSSSE